MHPGRIHGVQIRRNWRRWQGRHAFLAHVPLLLGLHLALVIVLAVPFPFVAMLTPGTRSLLASSWALRRRISPVRPIFPCCVCKVLVSISGMSRGLLDRCLEVSVQTNFPPLPTAWAILRVALDHTSAARTLPRFCLQSRHRCLNAALKTRIS